MADSIAVSLQNAAADEQAIIYVGTSATLNVILTNGTGAAIAIDPGATIEIFMPFFFTAEELKAMSICNITPADWSFSYDAADMALLLTNSNGGTWAAGDSLRFEIDTVQADAAPTTDSVQFNFNGLKGNSLPLQVSTPLALNKPVSPGQANLSDSLLLNLGNQGNVIVSAEANPLTNTIFLNFKNTGATALYNGDTMWTGTPKVMVSFVYGTTSGSLAPDQKSGSTSAGSAWQISGSVFADQTAGWSINNPAVSGQNNSPVWELAPNKTNQEIIGTGDEANVTFAFSQLVSLTPPGPTQMYLQFTGFTQNESTIYNDALFVLPINKIYPPNPGAIAIWSPLESITVTSKTENLEIPLTWSMYGVGSVKLSFYVPGMHIPDQIINYEAAHDTLNYDSYTLQFSGLEKSQLLTIYCFAYTDKTQGTLLNKVECSIPLNFPPIIHSFTIASIPNEQLANGTISSNLFFLQWDIAGETSFEIVAQNYNADGTKIGNAFLLKDIPQDATEYKVASTAARTTYTMNLYQ